MIVGPQPDRGAFHFDLPEELIAQTPCARRSASRLLLVDSARGVVGEHPFADLPAQLQPGDLLVLNDSRVLPARLETVRCDTGGRVELLLVAPLAGGSWEAMARPARRLRPGVKLEILTAPDAAEALAPTGEVLTIMSDPHEGMVEITGDLDLATAATRWGAMPLPPYIHRDFAGGADLVRMQEDRRRYQTVYAAAGFNDGASVAAPTAGLHFDAGVLDALQARGVATGRVRLHVGPGTFRPPDAEQLRTGLLHPERFHLPGSLWAALERTRAHGGRVIAVGTTSLRVLETVARLGLEKSGGQDRVWDPGPDAWFHGRAARTGQGWDVQGTTRLFIRPPATVTAVDGLLTNFHLPGSSLLMLVGAFLQTTGWQDVYAEAVGRRLRFYSYGDCMLAMRGSGEGV